MKKKVPQANGIDMSNMDQSFFLIGLLNEFMNKFQTVADQFLQEISWKQYFLLVCIQLFQQPPTLIEVAEMMGTSYQNVKQMLVKLESQGYICLTADSEDKRKKRILLTKDAKTLMKQSHGPSNAFVEQMFGKVNSTDLEVTIQTIMRLDEYLNEIRQS